MYLLCCEISALLNVPDVECSGVERPCVKCLGLECPRCGMSVEGECQPRCEMSTLLNVSCVFRNVRSEMYLM